MATWDLDSLMQGAESQGEPASKKGRLADAADGAEDSLMAVEFALKDQDLKKAISILLKLSCHNAQLLRDLTASEWHTLVCDTDFAQVEAAKAAGKKYAEAAKNDLHRL